MKNHLNNIIALNRSVIEKSQQAISEAETALAKLAIQPPQTEPSLRIIPDPDRPDTVIAIWDKDLAKLPGFDIHFYNAEGNHRDWQLSIRTEVPDADLSVGEWKIPLNFEGLWKFEARAEGYRDGVVKHIYDTDLATSPEDEEEPGDPEPEPQPEPEEPEPPVQRRVIPIGFWDHYINDARTLPNSLLPYVSIGKSMSRTVNRITNAGLPAIMHLGNLSSETQDERKKRVRSIPQYIQNRAVDIIHFIDEPLSKGIPGPVLDELVDYAREVHGDRFQYAYTINGAELYYPGLRPVDSYAQRFDYVFHQAYPYRHIGGTAYLRNIGNTKADLFATMDLRLKTLKEKIPNSKFWFVPQGFYSVNAKKKDRKYKLPPAKSPIWYTEWAMANEEVQGLIWWKYFTTRDKIWHAMDRMPEHMESFKKAFRMMGSE